MRIALDAMGGDHAPGPIVAGAVQAVAADPELRVVLVGDQAQVEPLLAGVAHRDRLALFHCTQAVGMEESPVVALRKKPDNSISRCWQLLAQQKVEGIVSAGNTGAMVAGGLFLKRFLQNVRRPGIAAVMPTLKGPCVLIDVGANVNPKPEHLFQYGVMGSIFARHILQRTAADHRPDERRLGGAEGPRSGQGNARPVQRQSAPRPVHRQRRGPRHSEGAVDVVVCDGFVGNVVLKTSEGVFEFSMKMAFKELLGALDVEREKAKKALEAWSAATITVRSAAPRCWASTAFASSATAAPAIGPSRTPWAWPPVTPARVSTS